MIILIHIHQECKTAKPLKANLKRSSLLTFIYCNDSSELVTLPDSVKSALQSLLLHIISVQVDLLIFNTIKFDNLPSFN